MGATFSLDGVVKSRQSEGIGFRLIVPSLTITPGEQVALVGQSGSGKSTLLDILAMVLEPDSADRFDIDFNGEHRDIKQDWANHDQDALGELRKQHVGYVLQTGGLLPFLSVRDNISLSRRVLDLPDDDTVENLAGELDIRDQLNKSPGALSAGQRQRVAIARALAHRPDVVIADEPTASLDPITARKVMSLFVGLVEELGMTLIIASHDWAHVDKLGLRKLTHRTRQRAKQNISESTFGD